MSREELRILRERVLSDCPEGLEFWTCHGTIIKNIYELRDTIRALNEHAFRYHVNEDNKKNDFADWVYDVLGDTFLAYLLKKTIDKEEYLHIIEERIAALEEA
jgi:hypothetical protein